MVLFDLKLCHGKHLVALTIPKLPTCIKASIDMLICEKALTTDGTGHFFQYGFRIFDFVLYVLIQTCINR